jgi:hypothetical protein
VRAAAFPIRLFLITRVAIIAVAAISIYLLPGIYSGVGMRPGPFDTLDALCPWDCEHYANLALLGYRTRPEFNFWPLLPLLARPLVWLHVEARLAVLLVANLASLGAFVAVHACFRRVEDEAAADWGTTLFAAYPFAFFFASGYAESLMVFAGAAALALALSGRHLAAGAALAAGVLARHTTLIAGLGLLAAQLRETGARPWRLFTRPALLGLILPIPIFLLFPVYSFHRYHDLMLFSHARDFWGWHAWLSVREAWQQRREVRVLAIYPFIAWLPLVGALALLGRRRWWPLAAVAIPLMTLFVCVGGFSLGRYSASCWPAFLPLGAFLARRPSLQAPIVLALALLQGLFLHLFAHAYEIQ